MTKHLHDIYNNSYHSEELILHVVQPLATEYWMRPENGGRRPTIHHPLLLDHYARQESIRTGREIIPDLFRDIGQENLSERFPNDQLKVLEDTSPEKLASYISRCHADTVALDGIEELFFRLYDISPGVKVISLDWRSYDSWQKSVFTFAGKWIMLTWTTNTLYSSLHGLPWGALLKLADPLFGGRIKRLLQTGEAFLHNDYDVPVQLWCVLEYQRIIYSTWWGGLMKARISEEEYYDFFRKVDERVPPENLFHWNFKNNTWEDLCEFLSVEDCPNSGVLEHAPNINAWDKVPFEEVVEPLMLTPLFLLLHWANWRVYGAILMALFRLPLRLIQHVFKTKAE